MLKWRDMMSTYVLVHGGNMSTDTWNKLSGRDDYPSGDFLGGRIWDCIIPNIEVHEHRVFAPTLKEEHSSTLTEHINQIYTLIEENNLDNVILVGHSYGGMIITGVASKIPEKIQHLAYVDAALPDPGQSLFDIITSGGRDPLSFVGLEPAAPYVEKIHFEAENIKTLPKTYILCTESEFSSVTSVAREKIAAGGKWHYIELPTSHVPMASMPGRFTELLLEIGEK